MKFSDKVKLEKEYYKWIESASKQLNEGERVADCPFSVFTFLDNKGLLVDSELIYKKLKSKWQQRLDDLKAKKQTK